MMKAVQGLISVCSLIFASNALAIDEAAIEAYSTMSEVRGISISPSGQRVAIYQVENEKGDVFVIDLDTDEVISRVRMLDSDLGNLRYFDEDFVFLEYKVRRFFGHLGNTGPVHMRMLDMEVGRLEYVGRYKVGPSRFHVVGKTDDKRMLFLSSWTGGKSGHLSMFKYEIDVGLVPKSLATGNRHTLSWFVGEKGKFFIREDFDPDRDYHSINIIRGKEETVLYSQNTESRVLDVVGMQFGGKALVYRNMLAGSNQMSYHLMDLATGETSAPIFSAESSRVLYDIDYNVLGFESGQYPNYEYEFLVPELSTRFEAIQAAYPGATVRFLECTNDRKHIVVGVSSDWSNSYYLRFTEGQEPKVITMDKRAKSEDPVRREILSYAMPDGSMVRTRITATQKTLNTKAAPTVVLANWPGQDFTPVNFTWAAEFMANQGYIVVMPEVRGSEFSGTFLPQGKPEWKATPIRDLDRVLSGLSESGVIDPTRLCIVGHGVGGFTSLAAATNSQFDFKCVVSLDGVADLDPLGDEVRRFGSKKDPIVTGIERVFGFDTKDKDSIKARSPIDNAAAFSSPTLLMYFKKGVRFRELQATRMSKALKKAGKNVTLVALKGEDTFVRRPDGRKQFLEQLALFLEQHLPAGTPSE